MLSLENVINKISQFRQLVGVAINLKLALGDVDFMRSPVREHMSVSYVWPNAVQITKH